MSTNPSHTDLLPLFDHYIPAGAVLDIAATISKRALVVATSLPLCGCQRVPSVNVLGAYFPSWVLCALAGIALTLVARWAITAAGLDTWIGPRVLMYPALALAFTLVTWIAFFRG